MTRTIRTVFSTAVLGGALTWAAPVAALSVISTNVEVDWDSLSITDQSGALVSFAALESGFTYLRADSRLNDTSSIGTPYTASGIWPTSHSVSNSNANAEGTAGIASSLLSVSATAQAEGTTAYLAGATADQHRATSIAIQQDITLTFSIDYLIEVISSTSLLGEGNSQYSRVAFYISHTPDENPPANNDSGSQPPVWDVFSLTEGAGEGTLSFTASLLGGESYGLEVHLYSSLEATSPWQEVPEPSILALLGLGLLGMAARRGSMR